MKFTKMQGLGNDYIYINAFEEQADDLPALARRMSDRHFGVGGDGLVLIAPSDKADFRMIMYNADGSRGAMCGNASRCVAKYVYDRGMTDKTVVTLETDSGVKTLNLTVENGRTQSVCVDMGALDAFIVDTDERKHSVWSTRGAFLEAIKASAGEMDECDVVVPRNRVADFIKYTHKIAEELAIRIPSFGHAGDGNFHVYICRDDLSKEEFEKKLAIAFERMYRKSYELRGLVSGEHGIGYAKKSFMAEQYGATQVEIMRGIKRAFDPKNILNPDKVI